MKRNWFLIVLFISIGLLPLSDILYGNPGGVLEPSMPLSPIYPENTNLSLSDLDRGLIDVLMAHGFEYSPEGGLHILILKRIEEGEERNLLRMSFSNTFNSSMEGILKNKRERFIVQVNFDRWGSEEEGRGWQYLKSEWVDFLRAEDVSSKMMVVLREVAGLDLSATLLNVMTLSLDIDKILHTNGFRANKGGVYLWKHEDQGVGASRRSYEVQIRLVDSIRSESVFCDITLLGSRFFGREKSSRVILRVSSDETLFVLKALLDEFNKRNARLAFQQMEAFEGGGFYRQALQAYSAEKTKEVLASLRSMMDSLDFKGRSITLSDLSEERQRILAEYCSRFFIYQLSGGLQNPERVAEALRRIRASLHGVVELPQDGLSSLSLRREISELLVEIGHELRHPMFSERLIAIFLKEFREGLRRP